MIEHLGAVASVRDRIHKRASDSRLKLVPGLADDLQLIGEAFGTLEDATKMLARVFLSKHYGYSLSTAEYQFLASLAGEVAPGFFLERAGG